MRNVIAVVLFSAFLAGSPCLFASHIEDVVPDPSELAALEAKASQAAPRDRCFLYAKVVDEMTLLAGHQFETGDLGQASATLQSIQRYAQQIRNEIARDSRRLKNAEVLMQHTSFRLQDILRSASYENRPPLEATLKQLNQVQSQLMMQVFNK
jgi:hypothetical protein